MNNLEWLQNFYLGLCDGDWEHTYGPDIGTIDNPGWKFEFPIVDTPFEVLSFDAIKINRNEHDWVFAELGRGKFLASCGPLNLDEAIGIFRKWIVESDIGIPSLTNQEADAERTNPLRSFVRLQKKSWRDG